MRNPKKTKPQMAERPKTLSKRPFLKKFAFNNYSLRPLFLLRNFLPYKLYRLRKEEHILVLSLSVFLLFFNTSVQFAFRSFGQNNEAFWDSFIHNQTAKQAENLWNVANHLAQFPIHFCFQMIYDHIGINKEFYKKNSSFQIFYNFLNL